MCGAGNAVHVRLKRFKQCISPRSCPVLPMISNDTRTLLEAKDLVLETQIKLEG